MNDEEAMAANLSFEECDQCLGTAVDADGRECPHCKGYGTLAVWEEPVA